MNILIDLVPHSVVIDDQEYEINSDFRTSILFELLMSDRSLLDTEKGTLALQLYYPVIPENLEEAVDQILWFYRCGKEIRETTDQDGNIREGKKQAEIYSFEHDSEYFYSAFISQYGINLQTVEFLHWWEFKALFAGIKEDEPLSKIMSYRAVSITSDMTESEKKHYREMKKIYALPDSRSTEEKETDFVNTFGSLF